jgi:hypothetical protein
MFDACPVPYVTPFDPILEVLYRFLSPILNYSNIFCDSCGRAPVQPVHRSAATNGHSLHRSEFWSTNIEPLRGSDSFVVLIQRAEARCYPYFEPSGQLITQGRVQARHALSLFHPQGFHRICNARFDCLEADRYECDYYR